MNKALEPELLEASIIADPLNEKGLRTRQNTPLSAYNCGGFALKTYDWVTPYTPDIEEHISYYTEEDREEYMLELADECDDLEIGDCVVWRDADELCRKYPFLEVVHLEDTVLTDRVIAYRVFVEIIDGRVWDTDFHFKVRENGFWFEKNGDGPVRLVDLDADKPWISFRDGLCYTSEIVYFIDRRTV